MPISVGGDVLPGLGTMFAPLPANPATVKMPLWQPTAPGHSERRPSAWSCRLAGVGPPCRGGMGKSAIVNEWVARLATHDYGSAERVFAWSFFNQERDQQDDQNHRDSVDKISRRACQWIL